MSKGLLAALLALFVVSGCVSDAPHFRSAEVRLQLGMHYLAAGDYAAAQRNLLRAQAVAPRDYRIPLALARLAQQQENLAASVEHLSQAQRLAPKNGYVANNYGAFLCALGQYDEAHQQFKRAMDAPEGDARTEALELSGYCYLQAGDKEAARSALLHALDADRGKGEALLAEAERLMEAQQQVNAPLLLEIYQQRLPETARSLALHIRFAAQQGNAADIHRYGDQLARRFPQSIQYQRYLANEY
ncbi:type IV pilus biogenesis/stability protein PilW [Pantoea sp. LMR881]|uniref:type IV pilus biogenesis/stability protein PilW n=1 Tax=Pantoea sp. LMR881 TaxID=3014336 RepID=UPI0022AFDFF9|nr:type IV pilus biogenesis/stability protein PilW [Pantoea sp. LMR881]MCZ4060463.1 type IV pilus biogenesis/stability protein PilW [Pantoea sp. LMR881]